MSLHSTHVSEAVVVVGGTPESLELAMDIKSGDVSLNYHYHY